MESFTYTFAALRGVQAGREYFVAMCPLRLLPRLLQFDSQELPPELRAQRVLNRARIPALTRYIVEHLHDYVFSAITASIDGQVQFTPVGEQGALRNVGQLTVPLAARFIVNDGQHRRAAIEEALRERPDLGDETINDSFWVNSLRFGLGRSNDAAHVAAAVGIVARWAEELRAMLAT